MSHLNSTHSICFQFLKTATPESIAPPLPEPRLSCPLQPMLLGSPCPLQHLLTLRPGFVNFKVSILTMVHPNFNVCSLLLDTQINTNSLESLKFNKPLSLTPTQAPKGNWDTLPKCFDIFFSFQSSSCKYLDHPCGERAFFYFPYVMSSSYQRRLLIEGRSVLFIPLERIMSRVLQTQF